MPYSGLMPSLQAIQQAVREPLLEAPTDPNGFAVYIFERARKIDRERALAKKPTVQSERRPSDAIKTEARHDARDKLVTRAGDLEEEVVGGARD
jgi:hypothetical protein